MRFFLASAVLACAATATYAAPLRPFTVADSIGFSTFVYPGIAYEQATPRILRSPDGSHFAAVTVKGDVSSGKRVAMLWVFDATDVARVLQSGRAAPPRVLATWASASNTDPVSQWRWRSDSSGLLFLGANDEGNRTIYSAGLSGGDLRPVSMPGQDVSQYTEAKGQLAYLAHPAVPESLLFQAGGPELPDIVEGFGKNVMPLLFPNEMAAIYPGEGAGDVLWRVSANGPVAVRNPKDGEPIRFKDSVLVASPDGSHVLARRYAAHVPPSWERYRPIVDYPGFRFVADKPGQPIVDGIYRPQSYVTINLLTGEERVLLDAPINGDVQFQDFSGAWSPDGKSLAVSGAYPALHDDDTEVLPCTLGIIDVASAKLSCLEKAEAAGPQTPGYNDRPQIVGLDWNAGGSGLLVRTATLNAPDQEHALYFADHNGAWSAGSQDVRDTGSIRLGVHESVDEQPVVVAERNDGRSTVIFDPNPQFAETARASIISYSWKNQDGDVWTGALMLPPDYRTGHRYPLVIQTHGLKRGQFLVDGPSPTGFAARALAARGIIVLQVAERNKKAGTPEESPLGAAGYHAAIEALDAEGKIDPHKVGAIAWSHYGPWVMQGLVDRPTEFAAVSFAETAYNGYDEYLQNVDYLGASREQMFRAQVGPKPFGSGLQTWFKRSAGFQTDRVCTPMFWQINDPMGLPYGWGTYAALRAEHKPLDLLYVRGGQHVLVKPSERLIEQGMNVDWFDYWLNGRKSPSPTTKDEYARWDQLKSQPRCGDEGITPSPTR